MAPLPFYGGKRLVLDAAECLVSTDRVFVGNQPDEFAVTGLVAPGARVLLLGLGYGAALRPLGVFFSEDLHVVAVENNPRILRACQALFEEYLPGYPGELIEGDAVAYVAGSHGPYDAICVDIYTDEGYPGFLFDPTFWGDIDGCLRSNGVVVVNAFGLPEHLSPLRGPTPQHALVAALGQRWGDVRSLPCRRNMTLVAGREMSVQRSRAPSAALRGTDELIAHLWPARWSCADPVAAEPRAAEPQPPIIASHQGLKDEMLARWPALVEALSRASHACGFGPLERSGLAALLRDGARAGAMTERLLADGAPEASFVPAAVAATTFNDRGAAGLAWYPRWVADRADELHARSRRWFVNVALWQALAMVANPFSHLDDELASLRRAADRLGLLG